MATLEEQLQATLIAEWGYVMGSAALRQAFGFSHQGALRAAIARGHLPVRTFSIEGRRGPFALTHDVAAWLAAQAGATGRTH